MVVGIIGGWVAGVLTGVVSSENYKDGILLDFDPFSVTYALIKTVVFAFILTSIPAYHGYYTNGGALEVGRSSTSGVVYSSVAILTANLLITQLLLIC